MVPQCLDAGDESRAAIALYVRLADLALAIPRAFSASAMASSDVAPACCISRMTAGTFARVPIRVALYGLRCRLAGIGRAAAIYPRCRRSGRRGSRDGRPGVGEPPSQYFGLGTSS